MKYFIYQVVKYLLIVLFLVALVLYLARTDKLPRFLPDEVRNYIIDFSDVVLSYDIFSEIYKPFSLVFDFLADDGYQYKYSTLPEVIIKRLDSTVDKIDNDINLFVNNPLFESWVIQSLIGGKNQVLYDLMKSSFDYAYLVSIGIYSSRGVEIAYSGNEVSKDVINYAINNRKQLVLVGPYLIRVRELKKDVDFIDGKLLVILDSKLLLKEVFNSELSDFKDVYVLDYYSTNVLFSLNGTDAAILRENVFKGSLDIGRESLNNKVLSYKDLFYVGFIYSKPNFLRVINIAFRIIIIVGVLILLIWLNLKIKEELTKVGKKEEILLKQLRNGLKQLPYKGGNEKKDINNLFVISTDQSLKYFENFVKTDVEVSKEASNRSLFKF
jgi:hypothetical protein